MKAALRRVALGLGVAAAAFGSLLLREDGPPPDDADLLVLPARVPDHENGFITLSAAAELLDWPADAETADQLVAMAHGERWDDALAARTLDANELALSTFARVVRNPAFQSPERSPAVDLRAAEALLLARIEAIRGIAAARRGDLEAALADALSIVRTGSRVGANSTGGLLFAEAGFSSAEVGLRLLEALLAAPALTPDRMVALARELRAEHAAAEPWRWALADAYRTEREAILASSRAGLPWLRIEASEGPAARVAAWLPRSYLLQPNNTLTELSAAVRLQQARAGEPCAPERATPPLSLRDLLWPNALGRMSVRAPSPRDQIEISRCAYDARLDLVRAALALLAFERQRGVLPPSLEALAPTYLEAPPADPFARSAALRLSRATRVVYSVGSDGIDQGGREDAADAREPRVVLPVLSHG